ncbi:glycosyltransferase [Terriglobus roseus DSM 18391]|uniref:Glycosyltransferase n=1 Tax=Terriglobus roseus (strain DSM 18391 / NRRL B-41598 / KBS 63) TaxID=926566 RepID=I3ZEU2_TERRK|nr:glycosyltransferase [Terriglobus roseus]AFL87760.1 glycosyltransferase [Terriglobus roseus DSM 18391]
MRILHVIPTLNPAMGGPIEGVRTLFTYVNEGYIGEAVTADLPDAPWLQGLAFPVHALGPSTGGTYGYNARLLPWLRANIDRFDGVIVNGLWQYNGLPAMLAARGRKPYMVFTHGMLDPYFKRRYPLKHLKKVLYWYPFEYWVLRRAYRVLFTTETEERLAQESFAAWRWRPQVVPYGIRAPQSRPEDDISTFLEHVPAVRGKRFLIYLSRIHPKKGCDLLLQAFSEVSASDPDLHLVMAGPDETGWIPELKAVAEKAGCGHRVHWPGILRGPAKWGAFRAAEAFILPSHQENFGIAVAEALAAGLPVLLSDKVNIGDMLVGEGCSLIQPDTLDGTRHLLESWIAMHPSDRQAMSEHAAECFRSRFDMLETAQVIMSLFRQAQLEGGKR